MSIREKLMLTRRKFRRLRFRSSEYRRSMIGAKFRKSVIPELLRAIIVASPGDA